jgi:hypothetical protein
MSAGSRGAKKAPVKADDPVVREESRNVRRLRNMVDFSMEYIRTQPVTHDQALFTVEAVKKFALRLFPDKEEAFDIIYAPKFRRLLNTKFQRS